VPGAGFAGGVVVSVARQALSVAAVPRTGPAGASAPQEKPMVRPAALVQGLIA
jgi:hypothetical protein